jgi:predicted ATPase
MDHFTKGLALLQTLPDTPERTHHEIQLHLSYATSLIITKGSATSEVEQTYTHAWELCQQIGETPLVFPVLKGLWVLYDTRAENGRARELADQFLTLARRASDPISLPQAYYALGWTLFKLGELVSARTCLEQSISCYPPTQHSVPAFTYGQDTSMNCLSFTALDLWFLGYPDQALQRSQEGLALARESSHPYSKAFALCVAAAFHQYRREVRAVLAQVEMIVTLSGQYGFPTWSAAGAILGGWVVAEQGRADEGITQMQRGIATWRTIGAEELTPYWLALLAQAYGENGQPDKGLRQLAEALTVVDKTGERFYEAEVYRLKGELLLAQEIKRQNLEVLAPKSQILNPDPQGEAEVCFQQALTVSRKQQAKSLELRAAMSLARLWQSQDKNTDARTLLEHIYGWFTEGFSTKDLQEAEALLVTLGGGVKTKREQRLESGVRSQKSKV